MNIVIMSGCGSNDLDNVDDEMAKMLVMLEWIEDSTFKGNVLYSQNTQKPESQMFSPLFSLLYNSLLKGNNYAIVVAPKHDDVLIIMHQKPLEILFGSTNFQNCYNAATEVT